MENIQA